ncbi:MAG: FlgD immunoglobulin-like domain containing protein, partial [Bradymonadaceae bacterium]
DANTTGGRVKDSILVMDQHGHYLDAKDRLFVSQGWKFYYADLSPLHGQTLTDIRIRYETTASSDSGDLLAYFDQIRIGDQHSQEIMNHSFEEDDAGDGTPDFWTNLWGHTGMDAPQVVRRNIVASHEQYSMQVFDVWCNGQGAQHVFHASEGTYSDFMFDFRHYAPEPTTFRVNVINMTDAAVLLDRIVSATPNPTWGRFSDVFANPAAGHGTARVKIQIIPEECQYPVFIDEMYVAEPIVVVVESEMPELGGLQLSISPNPFNPSTSISYVLTEQCNVKVSVYDPKGRLVIDLYQGMTPAGAHEIVWTGRDRLGNRVSSGSFFVHVSSEKGSNSKKITLLK